MGKKGQKGQKGFTIASKSNHSNQSFVCRRRKSINSAAAAVGGSDPNMQRNLNGSFYIATRSYGSSDRRVGSPLQQPPTALPTDVSFFVESLQSPTEPPKYFFAMSGRQSLAKELNALA